MMQHGGARRWQMWSMPVYCSSVSQALQLRCASCVACHDVPMSYKF